MFKPFNKMLRFRYSHFESKIYLGFTKLPMFAYLYLLMYTKNVYSVGPTIGDQVYFQKQNRL